MLGSPVVRLTARHWQPVCQQEPSLQTVQTVANKVAAVAGVNVSRAELSVIAFMQ